MRRMLLFVALAAALSLQAPVCLAADLTITTTASQAKRLADSVGKALGLKDEQGAARAATLAEVKTHVIDYLRNLVRDQERQAAIVAHEAAFVPFDPN